MICETYNATPGLDRFPEGQRFTVYRATHKRLMREDKTYRRRFYQYVAMIIVAAVLPGVVWPGSAVGVAASILPFLVQGAAIVYLAFRQQHYMNQRIGGVLQSQTI